MRRRTCRRLFPWFSLAIVLLALGLRLPYLTSRSLWFDEAFSWRLIQFPLGEFLQRAAADVHPILYYAVLWLWMRLFEDGTPDQTLFWLRLISVAFGAATVAAMVVAGRVLFRSRWIGAAAGLLAAVSAFQVQYAREARMYTLGTFLLLLATVALFRTAFARSAHRAWAAGLGFGLSLGAFLHVHYYALFSWLALGTAKLFYFLWRMRLGIGAVLRASSFRSAEVGFWLSAILFLPWAPVFIQQVSRVEAAYWIPPMNAWSIPNAVARLFWGGGGDPAPGWAVAASVAASVLVLVPLARGRSFGDLTAAIGFVVPIGASALVSLRTSVFLERYFLFAQLSLILLLARALSFLPSRVRTGALLLVSLLGFLSVAHSWRALDFPAHPGARAAAAFLTDHAAPEQPIVVSSSFVYFPISFHLGCRIPDARCRNGLVVRLYSESGEFVHFAGGPILVREDVVGSAVFSGAERVWVVDTTGFGGSELRVPAPFERVREERFAELLAYQGDIIVREYIRK